MKNIYKKAYSDYIELVDGVREFKGSLEELCDKLGGFNLSMEFERFDLNYKTITATIYYCNEELFVYRYIDIWDDENERVVKECVDYTDLVDWGNEDAE